MMAGKNSRWLKGNARYSKQVQPDLLKFNERTGFRNGARVGPTTGEKSHG